MPSIANSNAATKQEIRDVVAMTVFETFADSDATPSVLNSGSFASSTAGSTITFFDDGYDGQRIRVTFANALTTVSFSSTFLLGNGNVNWNPVAGDSLTATFDGTFWWCIVSSATGESYILKDADDTSTGNLALSTTNDANASLSVTNNSIVASSIGIFGTASSSSSNGIYGFSNGASGIGVKADGAGSSGVGLFATAGLATGNGIGVVSIAYSDVGVGINTQANHATGFTTGALAIVASVNGIAGVFQNSSVNNLVNLCTGTKLIEGLFGGSSRFDVYNDGSVTGLSFNTVVITAAGAATNFLDETGTYSIPDHASLTNVGTNTHAQIDTYISENPTLLVASSAFATTPIATADNAFAIGDAAEAADISTIALGTGAYASGEGSIGIGWNAIASGIDTIANNTAVGSDAQALGDSGATAVGDNATASGIDSTALGKLSVAQGLGSIAVGDVLADFDYDIKFGTDGINTLYLNEAGELLIEGLAAMYKLPTYTVATLPAASAAGMIYVSDGAAGLPVMAFSDATDWLRCDTLAAVAIV